MNPSKQSVLAADREEGVKGVFIMAKIRAIGQSGSGGGGGATLVYSVEASRTGTSLNKWTYIDTGVTVDTSKTYFCQGDTSRGSAYNYWSVIQNGAVIYSADNNYLKFVIQDGNIKMAYQTTSSVTYWDIYNYIYMA